MKTLNRQFINGRVQESHGHDTQAVTSAVTGEQIAEGVLGDAIDANLAVEAARQALPAWSATTLDQRREYLQKLADSFAARREAMIQALIEEFGTTTATAAYIVDQSRDWFLDAQSSSPRQPSPTRSAVPPSTRCRLGWPS